jgi:hypothetical protein
MTDTNREGPKAVNVCDGCRHVWHDDIHATCDHPEARRMPVHHNYLGHVAGLIKTPSWCPFLKPKKETPNG